MTSYLCRLCLTCFESSILIRLIINTAGKDDHVGHEDECGGTEDGGDDDQDDQELPVLLLVITLNL